VQGGEIGQVQGNSLQGGFGAAQLGPCVAPEARTDAQSTASEFIARETLSEQISVGHVWQGSKPIADAYRNQQGSLRLLAAQFGTSVGTVQRCIGGY